MTTSTENPVPASARRRSPAEVRLGPDLVVGGVRVPVIAGPRHGADATFVSLRTGTAHRHAARSLATLRADVPGALLVEPGALADLEAIAEYADAVVLAADSARDAQLLRAIGGSGQPVIVHRVPTLGLHEWLSIADRLRALGSADVVLVEDIKSGAAVGEVAELRERTGMPMLLDIGADATLAAAAVAAGADGVWMRPEAPDVAVAEAVEAVTTHAALQQRIRPTTLAACRTAVDGIDAVLAILLERRVQLAGRIQRLKPVAGHEGRDRPREAAIVHAMSHRAPSLDRNSLARIMDAVIVAGLDVAERELPLDPPVWRL